MHKTSALLQCFFVVFCISLPAEVAAQNIWTKLADNSFQLNKAALESKLTVLRKTEEITLDFPSIHGELEAFTIKDHSVLPEALAIKYPSIHAYNGKAVDTNDLVLNLTCNPVNINATFIQGSHSFDLLYDKNTDSYSVQASSNAGNYPKSSCSAVQIGPQEFTSAKELHLATSERSAKTQIGDNTLRILRTAVVAAGEYSNYWINDLNLRGASQQQQIAGVLSGIVTSLNNVNAVFERDLGVRFELVENNDELIFLENNADPFTDNLATVIIDEGSDVISNIIGLENIDIGHTLSAGTFDGFAAVGALCSSRKAEGASVGTTPKGAQFDFTFLAHEFGHQLGANHTQNYTCQRATDFTAVEPSSGSTIMSYAGIPCTGFELVQNQSDDYFHFVSITQIRNHIQSVSCGIESEFTGNSSPVIQQDFSSYTIPTNTNFILEFNVTDDEGDPLTYCWEQLDGEAAPSPPEATSAVGPLFRSFEPTESPARLFPREYNGDFEWETLPSVTRQMDFGLTVRDGNPGGISSTTVTVNVVETGSAFSLTGPANGLRVPQNSIQLAEWNVAGTNEGAINTENVRIEVSYDDGSTFETLVESTPNDGNERFTIPIGRTSENAKLRIRAINNVFYAQNEGTFNITEQIDDDLNVFENPVRDDLEVRVNRLQVPEYALSIYNISGQEVHNQILNSPSIDVDVQHLKRGFYIAKLIVGSRIYTRKFMKL